MTTQVGFPGIFGDKVFNINPTAFSVFGLEVRWYGLIICLGIILTVLNAIRCAHKEGISTDDVLDFAIWGIPMGIIGARAYYVLTSLHEYSSFSEAIAIWNGGLAIYGGIIGGTVTVFIVSIIKKIKFVKIGDAAAASIFIGQMIGRWGNFCNGEAFGTLRVIDLLGKVIPTPSFESNYLLRMSVASEATGGMTFMAHPTFLYESIWNLFGFLLANLVIYKKKKFDGQLILFYLAWYGLGRFFIEGFRTDSLYLGNSGIRISQLLAFLTFVFAVVISIIMLIKKRNKVLSDKEYVNQFSAPENTVGIIPNAEDNLKTTDSKDSDSKENSDTKTREESTTESEDSENNKTSQEETHNGTDN